MHQTTILTPKLNLTVRWGAVGGMTLLSQTSKAFKVYLLLVSDTTSNYVPFCAEL